MFDNGNVNWCMLGRAFFASKRAFMYRTMHFAVEPGFFVSNECYNIEYTWLSEYPWCLITFVGGRWHKSIWPTRNRCISRGVKSHRFRWILYIYIYTYRYFLPFQSFRWRWRHFYCAGLYSYRLLFLWRNEPTDNRETNGVQSNDLSQRLYNDCNAMCMLSEFITGTTYDFLRSVKGFVTRLCK